MENAYWLHCMVLVWDWSEAQVMERDSWLSILEFITCTFFSTYSGMAAVIRRELLATASAVAERRGVNYSLLHPRWRSVLVGFCIRGGGAYGVLHPRGRSAYGHTLGPHVAHSNKVSSPCLSSTSYHHIVSISSYNERTDYRFKEPRSQRMNSLAN